MRSTAEQFGIDPHIFKNMLYTDVLEMKKEESKLLYAKACVEYFSLPLNKQYLKQSNKCNAEMNKHRKALNVIQMWIDELK